MVVHLLLERGYLRGIKYDMLFITKDIQAMSVSDIMIRVVFLLLGLFLGMIHQSFDAYAAFESPAQKNQTPKKKVKQGPFEFNQKPVSKKPIKKLNLPKPIKIIPKVDWDLISELNLESDPDSDAYFEEEMVDEVGRQPRKNYYDAKANHLQMGPKEGVHSTVRGQIQFQEVQERRVDTGYLLPGQIILCWKASEDSLEVTCLKNVALNNLN